MAKRSPENQRRKLIDEQRKKARAAERRKTVLTVVICTVLAVGIVGSAVYFGSKSKNKARPTALTNVGVSEAEAGCLEPKSEEVPTEATGGAKHTARDGDRVDYPASPPTSGRHNPSPLPVGAKKFYSRGENPPPERAVHNLEHAYTVLWYDKTVQDDQIQQLQQAAESAEGKFLVMPWTRADFPDDKHIVLTAWGERQQCSGVSGAVVQKFMDEFGGNNGRAPEKGAL